MEVLLLSSCMASLSVVAKARMANGSKNLWKRELLEEGAPKTKVFRDKPTIETGGNAKECQNEGGETIGKTDVEQL